MPIYEYRCNACDHEMEALQKISDAPLVDCPACEKSELSRLISAPGFRLKGGGWYETDFKTGKKKNLVDKADNKDASKDKSKGSDSKASTSDNKVTKTDSSSSKAS